MTCFLGTAANPLVSGLTPDEASANGVAFGNGLVYVANGGAGVAVYSVQRPLVSTGCQSVTLQYEGRFTLGAGMSANNVYFANGWLVVATGVGGFHIIRATQGLLSGLLQLL